MSGGILIAFGYFFYPVIVFFLMKKYFEEKYKTDLLVYNKSYVEYEELHKIKYFHRPLRSLQIGLISCGIGGGLWLGSYYRFIKMQEILPTLWPKENWMVNSNIQMESYNYTQSLPISISLILLGISLIIYYYVSQNKLNNLNTSIEK